MNKDNIALAIAAGSVIGFIMFMITTLVSAIGIHLDYSTAFTSSIAAMMGAHVALSIRDDDHG